MDDRPASELPALAPEWATRSSNELAAAARSLATAWEKRAPSMIAAACACEDLDEASPLAADHWLVGDYLVRRFLARVALRWQRARELPRGERVRVHGLSRVEQTFWNLRSAEVERAPEQPVVDGPHAGPTPEGSHGAALVAGLGGSPWPAVLDALHYALVRKRAVSLRLEGRYARLAEILQEVFAREGDGAAVRVATLAPEDDLVAEAQPFHAVHVVGSRAALDALRGTEVRTATLRTMLPVVIVPTLYDGDELAFIAQQAVGLAHAGRHYGTEGVVALIVSEGWAQRDRFAALVAKALEEVGEASPRFVFHRDVSPGDPSMWPPVEEDAVVELPLRPGGVAPFLGKAVELCNGALAGGLVVSVIAHHLHAEDRLLGAEIDRQLRTLDYGMVGLNVWPSAFRALSDAPFGCHPESGREPTRGGFGFTQNAAGTPTPVRVLARAALKPVIAPAFVAKSSRLRAARELCVHQGAPTLARAATIAWRALRPS